MRSRVHGKPVGNAAVMLLGQLAIACGTSNVDGSAAPAYALRYRRPGEP